MTPDTPAQSFAGRFSVQSWFQIVLGVMAMMVIIGAFVGADVIGRTTTVNDRLLDQLQPAISESYRLQSALINQETGIRGYAIAADRQFLTPYAEGQQDEARSAERLRELLSDRPQLLDDLDDVERAAAQWRTGFAEPLIGTITPGAPRPIDDATAALGKTRFDTVRARFTEQNTGLISTLEHERADLDRMRLIRNIALITAVVAVLLAAIALTLLVRRLVARPLRELETASLRVADGDFGHPISPRGPADLAAVAEATERMRRQIVAELDSSRVKEQQLARQTADLDAQTIELRRSNAELEQFAYVASHDLQEPLRKVASFCQLLEKRYGDQLDDRATQYIGYAVDGAKRMQVLINDLLTFSRVGRVNDSITPTGLGDALDKAMDNIAAAAEESGLQIVRPDPLPEVIGDPTLLAMLWQNLLGNAVKFHRPDLAPVVVITCERADGDLPGWQISVSDNGIGIAPEFSEKVFVIFQRLHGREEYSGTGIGLALCKKIVEYHGGKIWIDPEYHDGTRISFTLFDAAARPLELPDKELTA
ncbi:sensor histidine kinase [Nocardia jejuensis]|uniref:sensor histidine kinase n=1 Tax=Nocardia jejuensis TaxID=328049 RepID=UPI00083027EE|nr:sensor histidine kinase [Nocardia jejuensis]